jgi:hypothetical protein
MSKQVKRRRGTTTEHGSFVGSAGEITVDTTLNIAVVHDGSQTGGYPLCKADLTNADLLNKISVAELNVADGISGQVLSTNGSGSLVFNTVTVPSNSIDGTHIALGSDTEGDIMYYNGTDWVRLAKGTAGQTLKMNAGATAPEWAN